MSKELFDLWKRSYQAILTEEIFSRFSLRLMMGFILLGCMAIRLATIGAPALDRTLWKEIDYIQVSTNYWQHGFHFLHPEITWPAEPPRVTAMEFPLVPYLASLLYPLFGFHVLTVRLLPLLSFLLLVLYVYLLAKRTFSATVGLVSALAAAILPLYHPFHRILFSEPLMIALSVMTLYHFVGWLEERRKKDWLIAILCYSLAIAIKLEPLYLFLCLFMLYVQKYRFSLTAYKDWVLFVLLCLILPAAWYGYAYGLAKHSIDVFGVFGGQFGGHNKFQTLTMLTNPDWTVTMIKRIGSSILGGKWGSLIALIGFISAGCVHKGKLFFFYLFTILLYFAIVAEGQLDAPYRQLTIVPPLSVFVALGALAVAVAVSQLLKTIFPALARKGWFGARGTIAASLVAVLLILVFNMRLVFNRSSTVAADPFRWQLAQEIKKYADPQAKLITAGEYTLHTGGIDLSPVLYYYSGLQGWSLHKGDWSLAKVDELKQRGAMVFAAVDMSREPESVPFIQAMKATYRVLYEDAEDELLLLDLRSRDRE